MKQLGTASMMYVQDYDETYPLAYFWSQTTPWAATSYLWSSQRCIQPYIKNLDLYKCPDDTFNTSGYGDIYGAGMPANISLRPISYMANAITPHITGPLFGVNNPQGLFEGSSYFLSGDPPTSLAAVPAAADIVMLIDGRKQYYADWYGCGPWLNNELDWCYASGEDIMWNWQFPVIIFATPTDPAYNVWRKHSGGVNVTFADGHSKLLRPGDLNQAPRWLVNPP